MPVDALRSILESLTIEGLTAIESSAYAVDGCRNAIAFFDSEKDLLVNSCPSYVPAVEAMMANERTAAIYGAAEGNRLVLQFVFNAGNSYAVTRDKKVAFEETFLRFKSEAESDYWIFRAVANVQNFECATLPIELEDGVSFRPRSFEELRRLLNWGDYELGRLSEDWRQGGHGSNVMMVETRVKKTPENFLLVDDGHQLARAMRMLLAMRLLRPGDVRIGRVFAARPTVFNVGIGGIQSYGFSHWHPGPVYCLENSDLPRAAKLYRELSVLDARPPKVDRNLRLALRAFGAIYDRLMHQADDRVVDAVTALEALWKLDVELSFRLAFRTASLLAHSDDERVELYTLLTNYYKLRSKVVHGGNLSDAQERDLRADEPLRDIVRRCLRGFLHLSVNPGEWTLSKLEREADAALLHQAVCRELQQAMQV